MNMNNSITTKDQGMTNKIFSSDNTAGAAPAVIQAILDASTGPQSPYGADVYSQAAEDKLSIIFECPVSVFLVPTGTAANALGLSVLTPSWGLFCVIPKAILITMNAAHRSSLQMVQSWFQLTVRIAKFALRISLK